MRNIAKRCLTKHIYCYKYFPEAAARRCSSKLKFKKKKKEKKKKIAHFTGKHLCWNLFLIKL